MRILRIAPRVPPLPGGEERHVLELTVEQAAMGHEVLLAYADGGPGAGDGWTSQQILPSTGRFPEAVELVRFGRAVRRWLRRERLSFDVVHAHGDYVEAWLASAVARQLGCPGVLTLHGSWSDGQGLRDGLRRWAYNRLDHVFCVSSELAGRLQALGVRTPITVQHSGTRLGMLAAIPRQPADVPTVVAVGNLLPVKGYEVLLEAVRQLAPKWPDLQVEIIGDGPLRESLTAAAADLPQVLFRGTVPREEVYAALRRAWVYSLSSIALPTSREGVPTALIEALAAGLPCIATDAGGVRDVLRDGENGVLVPPGDPGSLATALGRLLSDASLRERLGQAAASAAGHYDWPAVAKVYTAVCAQRVEERRLGRR